MPGRLPEAVAEYRKAIAGYQTAERGQPDLWEAHFNLGLAYAQMAGRGADSECGISDWRCDEAGFGA